MCEVFFGVLAALLAFWAIRELVPWAGLASLVMLASRKAPEDTPPPATLDEANQPARAQSHPAVMDAADLALEMELADHALPPPQGRITGLRIKRSGTGRWLVRDADGRVLMHYRDRETAEEYVAERERWARARERG